MESALDDDQIVPGHRVSAPACSSPSADLDPWLMQSNELTLDALLCRPDLERLQRLPFDNDLDKPRRQSASTIDEFFEWPRPPPGPRLAPPGSCSTNPQHDDEVFLRPPALWEDITSSIQKLDPDNAEMLGLPSLTGLTGLTSMSAIKMEVMEDPAMMGEAHQVPQPAGLQPLPPPHLQPHPLAGPAGVLHRPHPMQSREAAWTAGRPRQQHHRHTKVQQEEQPGAGEEKSASLRLPELHQGVHQELPPQGPPKNPHGREALPLPVGGLRVAVRALGRADAPLPQAHGRQAVPLQRVRQVLRALGPPRPAHEAPHAQGRQVSAADLQDVARTTSPGPPVTWNGPRRDVRDSAGASRLECHPARTPAAGFPSSPGQALREWRAASSKCPEDDWCAVCVARRDTVTSTQHDARPPDEIKRMLTNLSM